MNPGEDGQPHAVLVGKDGQEVNKSAGEGVVEILRQRDVEAKGEDDRPWCVGWWWEVDDAWRGDFAGWTCQTWSRPSSVMRRIIL
jgi:hypothetical protein